MPTTFKQRTANPTALSSVASNWQKLIHNAIRPAVLSQVSTTSTGGRHRQGGGTSGVNHDWFKSVDELQGETRDDAQEHQKKGSQKTKQKKHNKKKNKKKNTKNNQHSKQQKKSRTTRQ